MTQTSFMYLTIAVVIVWLGLTMPYVLNQRRPLDRQWGPGWEPWMRKAYAMTMFAGPYFIVLLLVKWLDLAYPLIWLAGAAIVYAVVLMRWWDRRAEAVVAGEDLPPEWGDRGPDPYERVPVAAHEDTLSSSRAVGSLVVGSLGLGAYVLSDQGGLGSDLSAGIALATVAAGGSAWYWWIHTRIGRDDVGDPADQDQADDKPEGQAGERE